MVGPRILTGQQIFLLSKRPGQLWGPMSLLFCGYHSYQLFPGIEASGRRCRSLRFFSAEGKSECRYIFTVFCAFVSSAGTDLLLPILPRRQKFFPKNNLQSVHKNDEEQIENISPYVSFNIQCNSRISVKREEKTGIFQLQIRYTSLESAILSSSSVDANVQEYQTMKCQYHATASNSKWWFDEKGGVICRNGHVIRNLRKSSS